MSTPSTRRIPERGNTTGAGKGIVFNNQREENAQEQLEAKAQGTKEEGEFAKFISSTTQEKNTQEDLEQYEKSTTRVHLRTREMGRIINGSTQQTSIRLAHGLARTPT